MKLKRFLSIAFITTVAISVIGCATKGVNNTDEADSAMTQAGSSTTIGVQALDGSHLTEQDAKNLQAAGFKAKNIIYFDYDSSQLKTDDEKTIDTHAQYLIDNPNIKILLEGHADERGSREYNMALGEKRAFSIKKLLQLKGVAKQQVQTVSFGEERPGKEGHDESAWSKNRRAVFVYASK